MRSRDGNSQDSSLERELAAVDAVLEGRSVDADFTELAEMTQALRADRPCPRTKFAEKLDARAAAGFPPVAPSVGDEGLGFDSPAGQAPRRPTRRFRLMPAFRPRRLPLAFGTAASLLVVVTALASSGVFSGGTGDDAPTGVPQTARPSEDATTERAAPTSGAGGGAAREPAPALSAPTTPAPPSRAKVLPHVRNRQVERDAALTLATPRDELENTADGVIQVTDRYEGFVLRSSVSGGDDGRAGATLDLRIPSERLQPAIRDLSELAHVRSRTQTTEDITARFVSARSRLGEATAERRALLRRLAQAATSNETASIRARLRLTNRRIAAARSSLRGLRNRVDFSTVAVAIEPDDSLKAGDGGWSPADALNDAVGILGTALAVLLVSLAVLVPVSILALCAWLVSSRMRRDRRERALDQGPQIEKTFPR